MLSLIEQSRVFSADIDMHLNLQNVKCHVYYFFLFLKVCYLQSCQC